MVKSTLRQFIEQLQRIGFLQTAGVGAHDIVDAIDILDALRSGRNDQERAAGNNGAGGKV